MSTAHLLIDWHYYPGNKRTATIYVDDHPAATLADHGADLLVDLIRRGSLVSSEEIEVKIKDAVGRPA
jgi:hypothetical protein